VDAIGTKDTQLHPCIQDSPADDVVEVDSSVDGIVDANPFLHAPVPVKTESEPLVLHPDQRHNVGADPAASVSPHVVASSSLSPLSYVVAVKEATDPFCWNNGKSALDLSDDSLLTSTVIIKPKMQESIHVSRRLILNQVMDNLKLKVHSSGYDSTLRGLNMDAC